jgi:hypothetical protein
VQILKDCFAVPRFVTAYRDWHKSDLERQVVLLYDFQWISSLYINGCLIWRECLQFIHLNPHHKPSSLV